MSDHIPDAGDPDATPIMDAVDAKCDELNVMDAICYAVYEGQKLEEKLNEANARIKQLEEQLMDSKNKYAVLVADVVLNEDRAERINRLEEALLGTIDWITKTIETGDVGYKGADEISEIISAKLALGQPVLRQYYYKQNTCNAESARSPDCICWHDEGTGPCNNDYIRNYKLEWRIKPKAKL